MNFNFLPPDRLQLVLRRPLPLALGVALGIHGLALLTLLRPPRPAEPRSSSRLADAPQLLRLGRKLMAEEAALARAQRQPLALNLPGLAALDALPPPPPPDAAGPQAAAPTARPRPAPAAAEGWRWSSADADLPAQAAQALELAQAWIPGSGSAPPTQDAAAQEIRRRQLWLTPEQSAQLQRLWQGAQSTPAPFGSLPSGTGVRRVAEASLAGLGLGLGRAHGFSLVDKEALVLLWRDGQQLWMLRRPLGLTQS
ncbi:MAG: hypothetical protein EBX49_01855 [Synechococcaceae bacterium WB8_1B_136]|nr:hypothetical protein [Synechococcaceae bacterium WB8_1B_136]